MHRLFSHARVDAKGNRQPGRFSRLPVILGPCMGAILVAGLVVAGGGVGPGVLGPSAASGSPNPHIMIVMMENHNYSQVIGKKSQPFTNFLARNYGLATESYAFGHPSLPNYLDLVSGVGPSNSEDDGPPSSHSYAFPTVADELHAANITEKAYAEDLPVDPTNDSGEYAVRHFPWEYFPGSSSMPIADASSLITDLNSPSAPSFVWYTPNLIDDEHDGSVRQGDNFLASFIPHVQSTAWYQAGGQIVITWDESGGDNSGLNGGDGGRIPTIVVSAANAADPIRDTTPVDTSGVLRSIEDRYGLSYLGNATSAANGNIDCLLGAAGTCTIQAITSPNHAPTIAGTSFSFPITTTGSPVPSIKKKGPLLKGLKLHDNQDGTATISGTTRPTTAPGTYYVNIVATYGRGSSKQITTQSLGITVTS
jgi:phosphatidylinositol-3-phosphatase